MQLRLFILVVDLEGGSIDRPLQVYVSIARTLLSEPALLLLDEPFSNLDMDIRKTLVSYVLTEIKRLNIPALMVSHDPRDAILSTNQPITFSPFNAKNP